MSSDFLITNGNRLVARAIKPTKELKKERVQEKREIERHYWKRQVIEWNVVAEDEVPKTKICSIQWLCSSQNLHDLLPDDGQCSQCKEAFIELFDRDSHPIMIILQICRA